MKTTLWRHWYLVEYEDQNKRPVRIVTFQETTNSWEEYVKTLPEWAQYIKSTEIETVEF